MTKISLFWRCVVTIDATKRKKRNIKNRNEKIMSKSFLMLLEWFCGSEKDTRTQSKSVSHKINLEVSLLRNCFAFLSLKWRLLYTYYFGTFWERIKVHIIYLSPSTYKYVKLLSRYIAQYLCQMLFEDKYLESFYFSNQLLELIKFGPHK